MQIHVYPLHSATHSYLKRKVNIFLRTFSNHYVQNNVTYNIWIFSNSSFSRKRFWTFTGQSLPLWSPYLEKVFCSLYNWRWRKYSHFFDKCSVRIGENISFLPSQRTAGYVEVDPQVCVISFHRHTDVLHQDHHSKKRKQKRTDQCVQS